jgi:hypothetical protein
VLTGRWWAGNLTGTPDKTLDSYAGAKRGTAFLGEVFTGELVTGSPHVIAWQLQDRWDRSRCGVFSLRARLSGALAGEVHKQIAVLGPIAADLTRPVPT